MNSVTIRETAHPCELGAPLTPRKTVRTRSPGSRTGLSFSALRARFSREIIDPASRRRCGRQLRASGVTSAYGIAKALNARHIPTATMRFVFLAGRHQRD
jgi:hypothetical protein